MVYVPVVEHPVASVTTTEYTPVEVTLSGSDIDGTISSYAIVDGPTHGTVSISGATVTTYTFSSKSSRLNRNSANMKAITSNPLIILHLFSGY